MADGEAGQMNRRQRAALVIAVRVQNPPDSSNQSARNARQTIHHRGVGETKRENGVMK